MFTLTKQQQQYAQKSIPLYRALHRAPILYLTRYQWWISLLPEKLLFIPFMTT
jgi:hypothetical protein